MPVSNARVAVTNTTHSAGSVLEWRSACGGTVSWQGFASPYLQCDGCGQGITTFTCKCGKHSRMECVAEDKPWAQIDAEMAEREAEASREAEQERRREANRDSGSRSDAPKSESTGCAAIPGALGITVVTGGVLALFVTLFGGGNWGYSGWCCCSLVAFAMLATWGAWQSVFKR